MLHFLDTDVRRVGVVPLLMRRTGLAGLLLLALLSAQWANADDRLNWGISPWTHEDLLIQWARPIVSHIETHSSAKVRLKSAKNLKDYYARAKQGEYDGFISPINIGLDLIKRNRFRPLLWVKVGYQVMIICDGQAGIASLADLEGQKMVFPSLYASTGLILLHDLKAAGVSVENHMLKDQWKVLEQLHSGRVKCGGVLSNLYESQNSVFKARFTEVYRNPMKLDALVLVPPSTSLKKQEAILTLAEGFYAPGSIVSRFDLVQPKEIQYWDEKLEPMLEVFRAEVDK